MMSFDELISNGQLTKAARLFAKEYYDSCKMGNTRRLLIEMLADKCDKYDAEITRQSVTSSEEVQEAIEALKVCAWGNPDMSKQINLGIVALQAYQPWVPVSERLPEKPQYDWVLVRITLSPDGFVGLPHIAELRLGKWFSTEYDLPIEQILQGTVTHWKPLPEPPKGE